MQTPVSIAAIAKRLTVKAVTSAPVSKLLRPAVRGALPIFMLHRFIDPETGSPDGPLRALRAQLDYARKNQFDLVALGTLLDRPPGRRPATPALAFTVDDGYADFAAVAAPVFAEFDCPVTVFVSTAVVDDVGWFWWDKVIYALGRTRRSVMHVETDLGRASIAWTDRHSRERAAIHLIDILRTIPETRKLEVLRSLPELLDLDIPSHPPSEFALMSWDEINALGRGGLVAFGPHSVTHPVLSRTDEAQAHHEIVGSWERLARMCVAPLPLFCYPNGDYTEREVDILERSPMVGALCTENRYASLDSFGAAAGRGRFAIPRIHHIEDLGSFIQVVSGFERVKLAVRQGRSGWHTGGAAIRPASATSTNF